MIFFLLLFLVFSNIAFTIEITTPREIKEAKDLVSDERFHNIMASHHSMKASDYRIEKQKWQVRKDNAPLKCLKKFCAWREKRIENTEKLTIL